MAEGRTRRQQAYDVLLLYNGSSHTGQDAMAPDQRDKDLALEIAKLLCGLLESKGFQVFFPYRNTLAGTCKFDALQESLENSKVVVMVFTPGFRLCYWEDYKQKYAFAEFVEEHRTWRLVPVCVGRPASTLPDCLKHYGMAELPKNWDGDSTQLDILLDRIADAVKKMTSFSSGDESQQALTSASDTCPPAYFSDVTSLATKALKEISSPESKPTSSLQSATVPKQPVTPSPEPTERRSMLDLPKKAFCEVQRMYSRLTSQVEDSETVEAVAMVETPTMASQVLGTVLWTMTQSMLNPTSPVFFRSCSLSPHPY